MYDNLSYFLRYYQRFLFDQWEGIGPQEYVTILLSVGVIGWYMMRRAAKL